MEPKSVFFLRVQIVRIHCKNRVWAAKLPFFPGPRLAFSFLFSKNVFFTTQRFASTGSSFFRFKDLFFHNLRGVLGGYFFGTRFLDKT